MGKGERQLFVVVFVFILEASLFFFFMGVGITGNERKSSQRRFFFVGGDSDGTSVRYFWVPIVKFSLYALSRCRYQTKKEDQGGI